MMTNCRMNRMEKHDQAVRILILFFVTIMLGGLVSSTYSGHASLTDVTSKELNTNGSRVFASNSTNIVLVHGIWGDGSVWSKVIPALLEAGHRTIAVQLPLNSLREDVEITKRAISLLGKPTILVGHSYGGEVITNAGYNNSNVTGLVYLAAIAPDEGENATHLVQKLPNANELLQSFLQNIYTDNAGLSYFNPDKIHERWAHDIDAVEASILGVTQKPTNLSGTSEKSGPPAWKNLSTWYQISENDRLIPPEIQRTYAERMNATILSLNSSHMSQLSHPYQIADFILNATREKITK
jgi:pimeloyl-ACP methyl ester carboxylesterase